MKDKLMAAEVWFLLRMLRIITKWEKSNDKVLEEAEVQGSPNFGPLPLHYQATV